MDWVTAGQRHYYEPGAGDVDDQRLLYLYARVEDRAQHRGRHSAGVRSAAEPG